MSADGTHVAIGANNNDGNGSSSGHTRVYDLNAPPFNPDPIIAGTAGDDNFVVVIDGTDVVVTNGMTEVLRQDAATTTSLTINGGNGNDSTETDFSGGNFGFPITFNGEGQMGAPGDMLGVLANGENGSYTPDATTFGNGKIQIGTSMITFTGLEPVEVTGAGNFTFNAGPNDDILNITNATSSTLAPALQIAGTLNGVPFESLKAWNLTSLTVDGLAGADVINVTSADNANNISNLIISAQNDIGDIVNVNGNTSVPNFISIVSENINLGNDITAVLDGIQLNGAVTLTANSTLAAPNDIVFAGTVNGTFNLDVNSSGLNHFQAAVGAVTPVRRIRTDVGGTTQIDADITTTILQRYREVVGINGNIVLTSADVAFQNRIVGGDPSAPTDGVGDLTITASGQTRFLDQIGKNGTTNERLASLTTNGGGTTSLEAVGPATTTNPNIAATGNVQFDDNVILVAAANAINIGGNIIINGTLEGNTDGGEQIILQGGNVSLNNTVGATNRLFVLQTLASGTIFINTNKVHTSGSQVYYSSVEINPPSTFLQIDADNGYISFLSTVRSTLDGVSNLGLTANDLTFTAAVGDNSQRLLSLTIDTQNEDAVVHIVNDVTFSSTVDLAGNFEQDAGTGTTILNGGNVSGNLDLNSDIISLASGTMSVTGIADFTVTDNLNTEAGISAFTDVSATTVTINGTLAPGASPGQLVVNGAFNIAAGTLNEEINNFTTAGTDYDQVVVTGTVDITGATLNLIDNTASSGTLGDLLVIIINDGVDPIVGTFAGIADGDDVAFNGETWRVFYSGGDDGNDVVLAFVPTSLPDVYVNDDFTQPNGTFITDTDPNTALDQNGVVGINAFDTIQEGVDAVDAAGNVNITDDLSTDGAATYTENVTIAKSVNVLSTEDDATAVIVDGGAAGRVFAVSGGGNIVVLTSLTIQNGNFGNGGGIGNNANLTVNTSVIQNNIAISNGGGIYNTGTLSLDNSLISTNTAVNGGGIRNQNGMTSVLNGSIIENNIANQNGGGLILNSGSLIIDDATIRNNTAASKGAGIHSFNAGSTLTITNTLIDGNSTISAFGPINGGGGISIVGGASLSLDATVTISNNTAGGMSGRGGGILVAEAGSSLTLNGTEIDNNTADLSGGGIQIGPNVALADFIDVIITNNDALSNPGNGGGLNVAGAVNSSITGGTISGNTAGEEGGGLWNNNGVMTIDGTDISNNIANSGNNGGNNQGGGGIFNNGGTLDVDDATITGNQALLNLGNGGGVMTVGGTVTIDGGNISSNESARAGGGIENNNGSVTLGGTTAVTVGGVLVADGNTAGINGGGLHVRGSGTTNVTGGTFQNNVAQQEGGGLWNSGLAGAVMTIDGAVISENTASGAGADQGGGGIFNNGGSLILLNATSVSDNIADGALGSGGGIFNELGGTLSIDGSLINNNTANRAGGGIELNTNPIDTFTFNNLTLDGNIATGMGAAPGNGGGLHVSGIGTVSIISSIVINNNAVEGGGLWNGAGMMTVNSTGIGIDAIGGGGTAAANEATGDGPDQGGGGIYNDGGTIVIESGSVLRFNKATGIQGSGGGVHTTGGSVLINNSAISDNESNRAGGGIEFAGGTLNINNSNIRRNITGVVTGVGAPGNGGGIHVTGNLNLTLDGLSIRNNTAANEGGGLWNGSGTMTITNTQIRNNNADGDDMGNSGGGGIYNEGGIVTTDAGTILNRNRAIVGASGSGGGILNANGSFIATGTTITNNRANRAGGGVEVNGAAAITTLTNVDLIHNRAISAPGNGGGMHITGASNSSISGSTINNNGAANEGGGLWNGSGTMTITTTTLQMNDARGDDMGNSGGGAIYNEGGIVTTDAGTVINNNRATIGASGSGGGILNANGSFIATGTTITNNNANRAGGGIEVNGAAAVTTLTDVTLDDNNAISAPGNGGGMHITGSSGSSITGGTVSNNSAANEGGGLWNGSGTMAVSNVFIFSNDANGDDSGASGGGGIYNEGGTLTTDATTVFNNNRATAGATGSGGGILVAGGSFTATGSSIINNDSNRAGGGIEVRDAAIVNLTNVILNSNVTGITTGVGAPGNGGGLHVTGTSNVIITGGTVNLNDAANEGGGLWNNTGVMTLDGTTITYNTASGNNPINGGGGVFNNGGTLNALSGTDISHNNVDGTSGSGGGIFSTNGTVTINDATIEENVANRAGGGIEMIDGNLLMNNTSLKLNNAGMAPAVAAPGNGGGLHISGAANATITGGIVEGNLAASEGGGLWNNSGTLTVDGTPITANVASGNDPTNGGGGIFNNGGTLNVLSGTSISANIADGTSGSGGGIFSTNGTITLTDVNIDSNQANRAGGGIEIIDGSLTLDNITLISNIAGVAPAVAAPGNGGGLHISGSANTNITSGIVDGNLAAVEGGGLWNGSGSMTVDGTTINGNIASGNDPDQGGGGIYNLSGLLDISNNTIISNNIADGTSGSGGGILNDVGGTLTIFDSEISGNTSNRAGGGIEDNSSSATLVTLNNVNLDSNQALNAPGNGGGLHITGDGGVNITNGTVNGNTAESEGGGLWNGSGTMVVDGTTIDGNTASGAASDEGGGGIYNLSGILSVTNRANITNNIADGASGSGGGILNDAGGTLTVSNSRINGNTSNRAGGGIEDNSASGTTVTLTNVNLDNNQTMNAPGNGGGLHVTGDGNVSIIEGSVRDNTAGAEGGGLWNGSGMMTVDKTVINSNTASGPDADNGGGGLFNEGGVLTIINAVISNNAADGTSGSGGGILNNTGTLTVSDTQMDGNSAMRAGGGIEENSIAGSFLSLTNVNLTNNSASTSPGNGGGLHITGPGDSNIFSGSASGNTAGSEGGALWNGLGIMTVEGMIIDGNSAAGADPDNGGGGIFNNGGSLNIIGRTNILNNMATGASGSGGGILSVAGDVLITECIVDSNSANRAGGAIEMIDGTLDISLARIVNNDVNGTAGTPAPGNGGAIHVTGSTGLVTISESNIANNEAALEGGALWNQNGTLMNIDTSTIDNNRAYGSGVNDGGAGIFNNGGMVDINTSTISNNEASAGSASGGAIHNAHGGEVMVMRSTISGNTVAGSGGGIFNNGNSVDVNATTIVFNEATNTGGGIEGVGSTSIKNTIVALNSASSGMDVSGTFSSNDYNLIGTDDLSAFPEEANDIEEADPVVGPLQDNGGLTQTHELLIGSAAFNTGDPADLFNDQIEQTVFDGIRDIGAYEAQQILLSIDEVVNSGYAIVVYPNPSKGLATIEIPAAFGTDIQITIVELSGKVVKNYKIFSGATELDFNGMANGVYIIKVVSENASSTHRLILAQ